LILRRFRRYRSLQDVCLAASANTKIIHKLCLAGRRIPHEQIFVSAKQGAQRIYQYSQAYCCRRGGNLPFGIGFGPFFQASSWTSGKSCGMVGVADKRTHAKSTAKGASK